MFSFARLDLRSVEAVRLPVGRRLGDEDLSSGSSRSNERFVAKVVGADVTLTQAADSS